VNDDGAVFKALADPTRRRLLDVLLFGGGPTVGELSAPFEPELTRFAVMKHLRVLEEAGLIVVRPDGRSTRHYLNAVPIRALSRRWMDKFTEQASDILIDLKRTLEDSGMTDMTDPALATQVYQIFIRASAEQIWAALTDPDLTVQYFHGARITVTPERRTTRGPEGQVWGDSPVEVWDPPHKYVAGWLSMYNEDLGKEPMSRITFEIEPQDDGDYCRVVVTHDRLEESPKTAQNVQGPGWMFVLSNLKTFLETGAPLEKLAG
jgi:DNA-binding transcriptional ArsR family regulator/uncharacterized protein YndB with AHSA1/START domain